MKIKLVHEVARIEKRLKLVTLALCTKVTYDIEMRVHVTFHYYVYITSYTSNKLLSVS